MHDSCSHHVERISAGERWPLQGHARRDGWLREQVDRLSGSGERYGRKAMKEESENCRVVDFEGGRGVHGERCV
jgi:hypothetical protein